MGAHTSRDISKDHYRIPGLDGIRGLAIGLVLFSHSVIFGEFSSLSSVGLNAGYTGVALFFVLSGYLITRLLLREEAQTDSISLRLFYARRVLRLFPALWLYLLVVWILWLGGRIPDHPWHSFVTSLFYTRNLVGRGHETDHLWSLSLEEQFYLLWPLVLVALPRRDKGRLLVGVGLLVVVTVWRICAARNHWASLGALYIRTDFRFDGPLYGCTLALAEQVAPGAMSPVSRTASMSDVLAIAGLSGLALWVGLNLNEVTYPGTGATVASLLGVILLLSQAGPTGWLSGLLTWKPLAALGRISYGVYLWQGLFLGPKSPGFQNIRHFPFGLTVTLLVSLVSFRFLEKPILRLKDRRFQNGG